jgi:hypothetical protein
MIDIEKYKKDPRTQYQVPELERLLGARSEAEGMLQDPALKEMAEEEIAGWEVPSLVCCPYTST